MTLPIHRIRLPPGLETARVLIRFGMRMVILTGYSFLGNQGFAATFGGFLVLAVLYCACAGAISRDEPFGPALTHWDEAAAYGFIKSVVHMLNAGLAFFPWL
jgi:hypothetical protein